MDIKSAGRIRLAATLFVALIGFGSAHAVTLGQVDDFEDGTEQGWNEGGTSPNPPFNVPDGGPDDIDDNFLRNDSSGNFGAGGKMAMFNTTQWAGDYVAAGIAEIRLDVRVISGPNANIRVGFQSTVGERYVSSLAVSVPSDGEWHSIVLPIEAPDLSQVGGVTSYNSVMTGVTQFRIFSSAGLQWQGDQLVMSLGVDNVSAELESVNFEGWLWNTAAGGFPPNNFLEEDYCFGTINLLIGADDNWTVGGNEVCYGRQTNNAIPPREYENFDGATFPEVDRIAADSSSPLLSAGGNLVEAFAPDDFDVEERIATILAEPAGSDLLILGGFENPGLDADGFIHLLVKSSVDAVNTRTLADLEGRWYLSFFDRSLSRTSVNIESVSAGLHTMDLMAGGVCSFVESQVFQEAAYDTNGELLFAAQFDADAMNLTNRGVVSDFGDATFESAGCTYAIDGNDYLSVSYTQTDGTGSIPVNHRYVVSDDNNYLVWAPDPDGVDEDPVSLQVGYRAPSALNANAIDGDYLFYFNATQYNATGSAHSGAETGTQDADFFGRGLMTFDSTTAGTVPAGQTGSWFACDIEMVEDSVEMQADGEYATFQVTTNVDIDSEQTPFRDCDFNLAADGALLLNLKVGDPGSPVEEVLFAGYANDNGELITLLDIDADPAPSAGLKDVGTVRHVLAMSYSGDPDANDDADEFTNLEEFQFPLPPPEPLQRALTVPNVGGSAASEIGAVLQSSLNGYVRDASTDALLGSQVFNGTRTPLDAEVVDINGSPAIAALGEAADGRAWVEVRDAVTGVLVRDVWFSSGFTPLALAVLPDMNGNNTSEVAVLMTKPSDNNRAWVHIKDSQTLAYVNNVWFEAGYTPLDLEVVPNIDGNAGPELAVLMTRDADNDRAWVHLKDAGTGAFIRN
ncbi:MAG: hypothetical protein ACR2Q3_08170, partial [Woeseiaceae bacterium]